MSKLTILVVKSSSILFLEEQDREEIIEEMYKGS